MSIETEQPWHSRRINGAVASIVAGAIVAASAELGIGLDQTIVTDWVTVALTLLSAGLSIWSWLRPKP